MMLIKSPVNNVHCGMHCNTTDNKCNKDTCHLFFENFKFPALLKKIVVMATRYTANYMQDFTNVILQSVGQDLGLHICVVGSRLLPLLKKIVIHGILKFGIISKKSGPVAILDWSRDHLICIIAYLNQLKNIPWQKSFPLIYNTPIPNEIVDTNY